jgi:hypothetical protein
MRNIVKAAAALALGGALALGVSTSAFAANGPTNLTGAGCPGSFTNYDGNGGSWEQDLRAGSPFTAGNGWMYGDYTVWHHVGSSWYYSGVNEYRCY